MFRNPRHHLGDAAKSQLQHHQQSMSINSAGHSVSQQRNLIGQPQMQAYRPLGLNRDQDVSEEEEEEEDDDDEDEEVEDEEEEEEDELDPIDGDA